MDPEKIDFEYAKLITNLHVGKDGYIEGMIRLLRHMEVSYNMAENMYRLSELKERTRNVLKDIQHGNKQGHTMEDIKKICQRLAETCSACDYAVVKKLQSHLDRLKSFEKVILEKRCSFFDEMAMKCYEIVLNVQMCENNLTRAIMVLHPNTMISIYMASPQDVIEHHIEEADKTTFRKNSRFIYNSRSV